MKELSGNGNKKDNTLAPPGHPVRILMEEHKLMLQFAEKLKNILKKLKEKKDFQDISEEIREINHIIEHFKDSESHYVREENVLFPYLEKYGITQPPVIMWMEHDKINFSTSDILPFEIKMENILDA